MVVVTDVEVVDGVARGNSWPATLIIPMPAEVIPPTLKPISICALGNTFIGIDIDALTSDAAELLPDMVRNVVPRMSSAQKSGAGK